MKVFVLLSGWNNRAIVAFSRFCKKRKLPFVIVTKGDDDPIEMTDYKNNVLFKRTSRTITLETFSKIRILLAEQGFTKPVIVPSTEFLNRFLLSNRAIIEEMGFCIPLCDESLYSKLSDKTSFEKLCVDNDIPTPLTLEKPGMDDIPFVIKPKSYFNCTEIADKPKIIRNIEDYNSYIKPDMSGYYFQEFVKGDSYYLLYYISKNGDYKVYSQKNYVQQHDGLSITAAESSLIHEDSRAVAYTNMLIKEGFVGLIMIEIRDYNGKFYMIEANPRLWGPSQLIVDSQMDLFDLFAKSIGFEYQAPLEEYLPGKKYFWFGGDLESSSVGRKIALHSGYTYKSLLEDLAIWIKSDIYNRPDTKELFLSEM